jgi:hypothetical protein
LSLSIVDVAVVVLSRFCDSMSGMSRLRGVSDALGSLLVAVHSAIELSDYDTFFRLYPKTHNLGKCIAKHIKDKLRQRALRVVLRSYKPSIPLETLMKRLGFKPPPDSLDSLLDRSANADADDDDDDDDDVWDSFAVSCSPLPFPVL